MTRVWLAFHEKFLLYTFSFPLPASWKAIGLTLKHADENNVQREPRLRSL